MQFIDPGALDLRHESSRMRHRTRELALASSLLDCGIQSPLTGVCLGDGTYVLFDGFKRCRLAKFIGLSSVPFDSLGAEEVGGICEFIRRTDAQGLSILEQAAFIAYLESTHGMPVGQIAHKLGKSKSWVSVRRSLLAELSEKVRRHLFADDFPVYAYMYFLRPFMRMNVASTEEIEIFVGALSGKKLSTREIERLAYGYFRGPVEIKDHINRGEIAWALKRCQGLFKNPVSSCGASEILMLQDLERLDDDLTKIEAHLVSEELKSPSFFAQAGLLAERILGRCPQFIEHLRKFHDRSRDA